MKKLISLSALLLMTIIFIIGCRKNDDDNTEIIPAGGNFITTTISGMAFDENNNPVYNAIVTAYGGSTTTNQYGIFVLKNVSVNKERCVILFNKTGFFKRQHCIIAKANAVNYVRIVLVSNAATYTVSATAGGIVTFAGGGSVAFQSNSFVSTAGTAYTGTVNLAIKHLSPSNIGFGFSIPGGDLTGVDASNDDVALYSYGMLGVELTGSAGQPLQLAAGKQATLTFPIATSQMASAPASIPLWYLDEATALWKEEGVANKTGNNYVGTVTHFTWWNCDVPSNMALVKGKVVDCNGVPVSNVIVSITANNGYTTFPITDNAGEYSFLMAGSFTATAQFMANINPPFTQNSQVENIPMLPQGQSFTIPDLIVQCPSRVSGSVKKCNGENTDAHVFLRVNNNIVTYQYTSGGIFNIVAPSSTQVELQAINFTNSAIQAVTTLSAPNVLNAGNILLCDTVTTSENSFIITNAFIPTPTFNMLINSYSTLWGDTIPIYTAIYMTGSAPPNFTISNYYIIADDTVPTLTTCDINIDITDVFDFNFVSGNNLSCNLTEVGPVGGKIKGTYTGAIIVQGSSGGNSPGFITGNFSVTRTQ